jgi:hypothetical protein
MISDNDSSPIKLALCCNLASHLSLSHHSSNIFFFSSPSPFSSTPTTLSYTMAAIALTQEPKKPLIPKLAQDLIAGTIGGWAQVVVGKLIDL